MCLVMCILVVGVTGYLIFKQYKPQAVLLISGIVLIAISYFFGSYDICEERTGSGFFLFDIFIQIKNIFSSDLTGLGLTIMTVGGYSHYMNKLGASDAMVRVCVKPLRKVSSPYLVLALTYIVGQFLNVFIPSAAGLTVLLMSTFYPSLIALGLSREAVASVIATTACLDLGPASSATVMAAKTCEISTMRYFLEQMKVSWLIVPLIAVTFFYLMPRIDQKKGTVLKVQDEIKLDTSSDSSTPSFFAFFPLLPLVLLLLFNDMVAKTVRIDIVSAMLLSMLIAMTLEIIYKKSLKAGFAGIGHFFAGMGNQFASTVSLIVAAHVFTTGLQSTGLIDALLSSATQVGSSPVIIMLILVAIVTITTFVTGSGNAAFLSFAALVPSVALLYSASSVLFILPMQLASGLIRSMSPVAACVIAAGSYANVPTVEIVSRTRIPMLIGTAVLLALDILLYI